MPWNSTLDLGLITLNKPWEAEPEQYSWFLKEVTNIMQVESPTVQEYLDFEFKVRDYANEWWIPLLSAFPLNLLIISLHFETPEYND